MSNQLNCGVRNETAPSPGEAPFPHMVWIPGGTFRMGSDKGYPEERPVHRVTVDGFWIDRVPVTNQRFARFVDATRHVTFAEITPKAEDYPGALPDQLFAGSLVFVKPEAPSIAATSLIGGTGCAAPIGGTLTDSRARSMASSTIRLFT